MYGDSYTLEIKNVDAGKHKLELTAHITRINTFGGLHSCSDLRWKGPNMWYMQNKKCSYEYQCKETGILKSPVVTIFEKL